MLILSSRVFPTNTKKNVTQKDNLFLMNRAHVGKIDQIDQIDQIDEIDQIDHDVQYII